jgi:hypothetical protein
MDDKSDPMHVLFILRLACACGSWGCGNTRQVCAQHQAYTSSQAPAATAHADKHKAMSGRVTPGKAGTTVPDLSF